MYVPLPNKEDSIKTKADRLFARLDVWDYSKKISLAFRSKAMVQLAALADDLKQGRAVLQSMLREETKREMKKVAQGGGGHTTQRRHPGKTHEICRHGIAACAGDSTLPKIRVWPVGASLLGISDGGCDGRSFATKEEGASETVFVTNPFTTRSGCLALMVVLRGKAGIIDLTDGTANLTGT